MFTAITGSSTSFVDFNVTPRGAEYAIRGRVGISKSVRATCIFEASNAPPTAIISAPQLKWSCAQEPCTLDVCPPGSRVNISSEDSYDADPGQDIADVAWDLDGDGVYDDTTKPMVTMIWDDPGTYEIGLRITDDFPHGTKSSTQRITVVVGTCGTEFSRGDANADGRTDLSDAVFVLNFLFLGGGEPPCKKSADNDDNGNLEITDGIYLLNYLFLGGRVLPPPFGKCGVDPTEDGLSCEVYDRCAE